MAQASGRTVRIQAPNLVIDQYNAGLWLWTDGWPAVAWDGVSPAAIGPPPGNAGLNHRAYVRSDNQSVLGVGQFPANQWAQATINGLPSGTPASVGGSVGLVLRGPTSPIVMTVAMGGWSIGGGATGSGTGTAFAPGDVLRLEVGNPLQPANTVQLFKNDVLVSGSTLTTTTLAGQPGFTIGGIPAGSAFNRWGSCLVNFSAGTWDGSGVRQPPLVQDALQYPQVAPAAATAAVSAAVRVVTPAQLAGGGPTPPAQGLKDRLTRPNFTIGSLINPKQLGPQYGGGARGWAPWKDSLDRNFNLGVHGSDDLMGFILPDGWPGGTLALYQSGVAHWNWRLAELGYQYCQDLGKKARNSHLIWYWPPNPFITWIQTAFPDAASMTGFVTNYVQSVLQRLQTNWPTLFTDYIVCNELTKGLGAFGIMATGYTGGSPSLSQALEVAVPAFTAARGVVTNPNVKLVLNDYGFETTVGHLVIQVAQALKAETVGGLYPNGLIDAVGFQSHFVGPTTSGAVTTFVSQVKYVMDTLAAANIDCCVTELDVRYPSTAVVPNSNSAYPALMDGVAFDDQTMADIQGQFYYEYLKMCLNQSNCYSFTLWGQTDASSWIPGNNAGQGVALPLDTYFAGKPAYDGMVQALNEYAASPP